MNMMTAILERIENFSMADMHQLSDISGVPFHTIYKIKRGETTDPGVKTAEAIYKALTSKEAA